MCCSFLGRWCVPDERRRRTKFVKMVSVHKWLEIRLRIYCTRSTMRLKNAKWIEIFVVATGTRKTLKNRTMTKATGRGDSKGIEFIHENRFALNSNVSGLHATRHSIACAGKERKIDGPFRYNFILSEMQRSQTETERKEKNHFIGKRQLR